MARSGPTSPRRIPSTIFSAPTIRSRNWPGVLWRLAARSGMITCQKSGVGQVSDNNLYILYKCPTHSNPIVNESTVIVGGFCLPLYCSISVRSLASVVLCVVSISFCVYVWHTININLVFATIYRKKRHKVS